MKKVRETLSNMENVVKVSVNFKAKTATVVTKKGALDKKAVKKSLKKAGYGVSSIQEPKKKKTKKKAKQAIYLVGLSGMQ